MAKYSTLLVWPVSVVTFSNDGYFHTIISFWEYPWVLTNSFVVVENRRLHTWDPVSMQSVSVFVRVFQNRMVLSADPPPEASKPWRCGLQARALTAALWLLNFDTGIEDRVFQTYNLLSFPPDARDCSSLDHLSPHTSWVCDVILLIMLFGFSLTSL